MEKNINQGKCFAYAATEADKLRKDEEAFLLYIKAINKLSAAIIEGESPNKSEILVKCVEYGNRALHILEPKKAEASHSTEKVIPARFRLIKGNGTVGDWGDVIGMNDTKKTFEELLLFPSKYKKHFEYHNLEQESGIMMYGPPGNGKSRIVSQAAIRSGFNLILVTTQSLMSSYQGESERLVHELFECGRQNKPCIIFLDEIDSLTSRRDASQSEGSIKVKSQLLIETQLEDENQGLYYIGATNLPESIDSAFRRRFFHWVHVGLPTKEGRLEIIKYKISKLKQTFSDKQVQSIARQTEGFSRSDLKQLMLKAMIICLKEFENSNEPWKPLVLTCTHIENALLKFKPTVSPYQAQKMVRYSRNPNNM